MVDHRARSVGALERQRQINRTFCELVKLRHSEYDLEKRNGGYWVLRVAAA